jgi:hypothetical protein
MTSSSYAESSPNPTAAPDLVFEEIAGVVAVEAEHFIAQDLSDVRSWQRISYNRLPTLKPDTDGPHVIGSSGGSYLEALPDSRWTHDEKLIRGENFFPEPGKAGVLSYKIYFNNPGRYYVWARHFSTGPEDNGLHVGLNGEWPESGQRWQTVKKRNWAWESRQRSEQVHVGEPFKLYLDIPLKGEHLIQFSMREDGFEFDKFVLASDRSYIPEGEGPSSMVKSGKAPAHLVVHGDYFEEKPPQFVSANQAPFALPKGGAILSAVDFEIGQSGSGFYVDKNKWLAIDPERRKSATARATVPVGNAEFHLVLHAVGENDGESRFTIKIGGREVGTFRCPMSRDTFADGTTYTTVFKNVDINEGEIIEVSSLVASDDGKEFSRGRWAGITFLPASVSARIVAAARRSFGSEGAEDSDASDAARIAINGQLKQWHKVTLDLAGPQADEQDTLPNPFVDYRFDVQFTHSSGTPSYKVPGYFAADGNAGQTSATSGSVWRAHLSPDKLGQWTYRISFHQGPGAAVGDNAGMPVVPFDGLSGTFHIGPSDKTGRDFRGKGRLSYVGKHHLQFAGTGDYFLKAGPDAPETLLAYTDFDNTETRLPKKGPLKTWAPHAGDWREGDPAWKNGKGKNLIGALNYLADKGVNMFSFLTYNAAGDGDNVWPYVDRDDRTRMDVSKLDQWGIVFDHAQANGLYLHFKLQENEMDDNRISAGRKPKYIPEALDGGNTGPERKLYLRELIARFGYQLALNWNIGEENTQSVEQQKAMTQYIKDTDPYDHLIVIHSFPSQQERVYRPLLGELSVIRGASTQNPWDEAHQRSLKWVRASAASGVPWIIPNDEQNPASRGVPPDPGYKGFSGNTEEDGSGYDLHGIRKYTLWGNIMAGGAGVEYYFGYQMLENDLLCEDFRSRDQSWDYCRIALEFFEKEKVPFWDMSNADALVGNPSNDNSRFCLAKENDTYLVYLPEGGQTKLDLSASTGRYELHWYDPRNGGKLQVGSVKSVRGGAIVSLGEPPSFVENDWVALVKRTR